MILGLLGYERSINFYKGLAVEDLAYCNPSSLVWRFWFARRFVVAIFPPKFGSLLPSKQGGAPPPHSPWRVTLADECARVRGHPTARLFPGSFLGAPTKEGLPNSVS